MVLFKLFNFLLNFLEECNISRYNKRKKKYISIKKRINQNFILIFFVLEIAIKCTRNQKMT